MTEKNIPHSYLEEAISTTILIMKGTLTTAIHDVTPKEKYTGKKLDLLHSKCLDV